MEDKERPILSVIQDIKSGVLDPKLLDKDTRRECVNALLLEGFNIPQVAQLLERSEKTILRARDEIRERNALSPDIDLAKKLIGELLMRADSHRNALLRLARKDGSLSERTQAEYLCWKVTVELTQLLQSLGYLPEQAKSLTGTLSLNINSQEPGVSFEGLRKQLQDIQATGALTQEATDKINQLHQRIEKAEVAQNIIEIKKLQKKGELDEQPDTPQSQE